MARDSRSSSSSSTIATKKQGHQVRVGLGVYFDTKCIRCAERSGRCERFGSHAQPSPRCLECAMAKSGCSHLPADHPMSRKKLHKGIKKRPVGPGLGIYFDPMYQKFPAVRCERDPTTTSSSVKRPAPHAEPATSASSAHPERLCIKLPDRAQSIPSPERLTIKLPAPAPARALEFHDAGTMTPSMTTRSISPPSSAPVPVVQHTLPKTSIDTRTLLEMTRLDINSLEMAAADSPPGHVFNSRVRPRVQSTRELLASGDVGRLDRMIEELDAAQSVLSAEAAVIKKMADDVEDVRAGIVVLRNRERDGMMQ
ncbi:hypothetical protein FB45DRAFT_1061795 [Roridomyces roridus]|uniref:Uncharacterized protein n=1 Tax=Roridomyces roridus TaxID=1738132 RepID=A0AAD7BIG0_9AGAR|nr:hypothetical protein FB45DRAFT_1061795 [Roridomyces roridus]